MNNLGGKAFLILVVIVGVVVLVFRFSEKEIDATALRKGASESAITPVAITHAKLTAPTSTVTLPGNIAGWNEAPMYARVEGGRVDLFLAKPEHENHDCHDDD